MRIEVDYIDQAGMRSSASIQFGMLELLKHMSVAGQGYAPSARKYVRLVGMFCHYAEYLDRGALAGSRLSEPPPERSDPTEKNHVSNVVGCAFADMLAKRLSSAHIAGNNEPWVRCDRMVTLNQICT